MTAFDAATVAPYAAIDVSLASGSERP